MFRTNLAWIIVTFLGCMASASKIKLPNEMNNEGRQSQSFFPKESSSNPNFHPSSHDVYYVDGSIQVADREQNSPKRPDFVQNPTFSPKLQEDLYHNQFHRPQSSPHNNYNNNNNQQSPQYQQYRPPQQSQYVQPPKPIYPTNTNEIYYNDISQQQYSPQSQHYVDNTKYPYSQPLQQSQPQQGIGPFFSPAASTANYPQHINRPHSHSQPQLYNPPTESLYSANPSNQYYGHYGGNVRPTYQSQQNYHIRPSEGYESGGTLTGSISNFISNAVDLFQNRPPVNQYQTPVTGITPNRGPENTFPSASIDGLPAINPVNEFAKAIEEITRNDDFQCIPKVICQMVGNQRRQPSILGSPIFSAIISALPSTSAGMVYGRAALLGLVSGAHNCHAAYPKCPHNEDDLLYYLNNHRGGFFRFFNGGAAFGDDTNYQYQPNPSYTQNNPYQQQQYNQHNQQNQQNYYQQQQQQQQQQQYRPQQQNPQAEESSLQTGLAVLQNIAEAVNSGGGINLSNLGGLLNGPSSSGSSDTGAFDLSSLASNAGLLGGLTNLVGGGSQGSKPSKPPVDDQGASLTELVGNLLTGFVGQRFASRKIQKRSIEDFVEENDNSIVQNETDFRGFDEIESRILNNRPAIHSANDDDDDGDDDKERFRFQSNRDGKRLQFSDRIVGPTSIPTHAATQSNLFFPYRNYDSENNNNNNDDFRIPSGNRVQKGMKFPNRAEQSNSGLFYNNNNNNDGNGYQQRPIQFDNTFANRPNKMIFPDRTGTGYLKFDHDQFNGPTNGNRYGKILNYYGNGNGNRGQSNGNDGGTRVLFDQENNDNNNYNKNRYTSQNYRPFALSNDNDGQNNFNSNGPSQIAYNPNANYEGSSNSQSNRQYPTHNRYGSNTSVNRQRDKNSSQNIYVTNARGQIEYYINAQGKKVYV